MPDEQNYESYLVPVEEAFQLLHTSEARVLRYGWDTYQFTLEVEERTRSEAGGN